MGRKDLRGNGTYQLYGGANDNPKLMAQELSDGRDSIYLEYYLGFEEAVSRSGKVYKKVLRKSERLGLYLWRAPRTTEERRQNRDCVEMAKKIRFEREQRMLNSAEGYRLQSPEDVDLLQWMVRYRERVNSADTRILKQAYNAFVDFLVDPDGEITPPAFCSVAERRAAREQMEQRIKEMRLRLRPKQLTPDMVRRFADYLQRRFTGEGPHTVFGRFKKMIRAAVKAEILMRNPCEGIAIGIDKGRLAKEILSMDEVRRLIETHYAGESPEIRRAFIFCLYTGLRWCDVKELRYRDVDEGNRLLRFEQVKTKGHSSASAVVIPLNDGLLSLIGKGGREERVFRLPSSTMCLKALRHWTKRAGIEKHITWHCARHSFAVNILNAGANIETVASLLGHSGLQHTEKYTRAVDSLKEAAINSLGALPE